MNISVSPISFEAKRRIPNTEAYKQLRKAQDKKASLIKREIKKAIKNNTTLQLKEISEKTNLPINQIVTIIYPQKERINYPEVQKLFNMVKDKSRLPKVSESDIELAKKMTLAASTYCTDSREIIGLEDDYIKVLAKDISRINWSEDAKNILVSKFKEFPAFTDTLIHTKDGRGNTRDISLARTVKELYDAYETNPDMAEYLVTLRNEKGNLKYRLNDVTNIINVSNTLPELTNIAMEEPTFIASIALATENTTGLPRFSKKEILKIYDYHKKMPKFTDRIVNMSKGLRGENETVENRFTGEQVCTILDAYPKVPDVVLYLIGEKVNLNSYTPCYKFNGNAIEILLKHLTSGNKNDVRIAEDIISSIRIGKLSNSTYSSYLHKLLDFKLPSQTIIKIFEDYDAAKNFKPLVLNI